MILSGVVLTNTTDFLCRLIDKLYILHLIFQIDLSEICIIVNMKLFGLNLSRIKWLWNSTQYL